MLNLRVSLYALLLSLLSPVSFANTIECKGIQDSKILVKPKTITIYNNSEVPIYPIISTSKNAVNEWIQGCFRSTKLYPTKYVYKLYVNEGQGIPTNSSVTITLPLFSKLSDDQYITWWNGGRVVLGDKFDNLGNANDSLLNSMPQGVSCIAKDTQTDKNIDCNLSVYSSDVQFPENIYAQLSEFTFGDSILPPAPENQARILKPENVGYNISYVDHVYLPVAIGPQNNPYIGYSGSTQSIDNFRNSLKQFLETDLGEGWPIYNINRLKLPGGYNIFAQRLGTLSPKDDAPVKTEGGFTPVLTVLKCLNGQCNEEEKSALHFSQAVQRVQNLWGSCVPWNDDLKPYVTETVACPDSLKTNMSLVQQFFQENHRNYVKMFKEGKCKLDNVQQPVPFTYFEAVKHIYGWVPFNEGCGAAENRLADTTIPGADHAKVQTIYIHDLQYNYHNPILANNLLFNPYVKLIHSPEYLGMDAYGFSVDDAVGFMSELGDGLIFAVGGTTGLENPKPFNYAEGFTVMVGVPLSMVDKINTPLLKKYGVCLLNQENGNETCNTVNQNVIMPDNSQIAGFRVGSVSSYPVKVSFTDTEDNVYTFVVGAKFAKCPQTAETSQCPLNKAEIFDMKNCSVKTNDGKLHKKSRQWCHPNPNQSREKQITKNYLSFPDLVPYLK